MRCSSSSGSPTPCTPETRSTPSSAGSAAPATAGARASLRRIPIGQRFAVERAWQNAGLSPADCSLIEGHGTSTRVGDAVELGALTDAFSGSQIAPGSIALGSVKSNIGHLKAAAGAAGLLKATLSLHHKMLPPSVNFERPNPNLDWSVSPFAVNTELRDWDIAADHTRVAGVSAFGFGGTNFHVVLEEYVPGREVNGNGRRSSVAVPASATRATTSAVSVDPATKPPLRGSMVLGADSAEGLANELRTALAEARQGRHLDPAAPNAATLRAPERIAIDYAHGEELVTKAEMALRLLGSGNDKAWPALRGRGIYRASGAPGKVAFLYTGQGSQYANMLADIRDREPVVAATFDEADEIMAPLLEGRRLSDIIFAHRDDPAAIARAEEELRRTEITQPAVITVDVALTRLLAEYGITPDMVMGHSVGEYGALVGAGAMSFADAIEAVSARGREMAHIDVADPGMMAAAIAPLDEVEELVAAIDGYVVLANINSTHQVVIGGASAAVQQSVAELQRRGHTAIPLPGQPRVPHRDRRVGQRAAAARCCSVSACAHRSCRSWPTSTGEFYPTDGDVAGADGGDAVAPGCLAGAVRQGPAHPVRRGRARVRRGRSEACASGVRVGRARRRHRDEPRHEPSEGRRHRVVQQRAVRSVGRRPRRRTRTRHPCGRRAEERCDRAAAGDRGGTSCVGRRTARAGPADAARARERGCAVRERPSP